MIRCLICLLLLLTVSGCSQTKENLANQELTFIVPGSPGGGWDELARSIQTVMEKERLTKKQIRIVYEEGDGGEKGWELLNKKSTHSVAMTSSLLVTNNLLGHSSLTYQDFTPLATMASEWQSVIVRNDSSIQTIADLMSRLKENPENYPVGIEPQFGNDDQIAFAQAAYASGLSASSIRFFQYSNADALLGALKAGTIAAASLSSSQSAKYAAEENVRIIAISSEKRIEELPHVPTWKEQGIPVVFPHWRGVMGPGGMAESEKKQWSRLLAQVNASPYWKEELKKHNWSPFYRNSKDTVSLLESDTKKYRYIMNGK